MFRTKLCIFMCFVLFATFNIGIVESAQDKYELKLLHVIFRHGIRTPEDTYPKDPYLTETFHPFGWGYLTNPGKLQMFEAGQYFRKRYNNFLGDIYNNKILYARGTDSDRTITSAELVCAGLFPQVSEQKWGPLDWQPIPVRSDPLIEDNLLLVRRPCKQYYTELDKVMSQGDVKNKLEENQKLFQTLSDITGLKIKDFNDVQSLYSTLRAEDLYGLKLPQWSEEYYPDILLPLTDYSYVVNAYNDKLKRLKGGVLLKKLLIDWYQVANQTYKNESDLIKLLKSEKWIKEASTYGDITNERKIFLYCGHDSTVTNLLRSLDVWDLQNPDYGITAIFELLNDVETQEFGVKIYLRNETNVEPRLLTVPGCDSFCPLTTLTAYVDRVIPKNLKEECYDNDYPLELLILIVLFVIVNFIPYLQKLQF